jgi:hypothetical protein
VEERAELSYHGVSNRRLLTYGQWPFVSVLHRDTITCALTFPISQLTVHHPQFTGHAGTAVCKGSQTSQQSTFVRDDVARSGRVADRVSHAGLSIEAREGGLGVSAFDSEGC